MPGECIHSYASRTHATLGSNPSGPTNPNKKKGTRVYAASFRYAGDFKNGVAIVYDKEGFAHQINETGFFIGDQRYRLLLPFHFYGVSLSVTLICYAGWKSSMQGFGQLLCV